MFDGMKCSKEYVIWDLNQFITSYLFNTCLHLLSFQESVRMLNNKNNSSKKKNKKKKNKN